MKRIMHSFWKLLIAMIIAVGTASFTGGSLKAKAESEDLNIDWNSPAVNLIPGDGNDANAAFDAAFQGNPPADADGKIYIKLTDNVTLGTTKNEYKKVNPNSQVYVNLNGHNITLNEKLCAAANSSLIFVDTSGGNGIIDANSDLAPDWAFEADADHSNLTLDHINVVSSKRVIHAVNSGNITIQNCNFTHDGDSAGIDRGGAVYAENKTISITNSTIKNYSVTDNGGAIYLNNANLTIGNDNNDSTVISGNTADHAGGGIYAEGQYTFTMNGGTIDQNTAKSDNSANYGGGGVRLAGGSADNPSRFIMNGGHFTNNRSDVAGGGGLKAGHYDNNENIVVEIHNGTFSDNSSHGEGGAISLGAQVHGTIGPRDNFDSDEVDITGNQVDDYKSAHGATEDWGGGGVFVADGGTLVIKKALVENNTAVGFGGGVAGCSTGRIIVDSNKENGIGIFNNHADGDLEHGLSGGSSAKHDDHVIAKGNTVFLNSGFDDYFCALNSTVDEEMLGGGSENWTGSYDSIPIDEHKEKTEYTASSIMGLTSKSSEDDRKLARDAAKVKITGNHSGTHGGGILCNGIMAMGVVPNETTFNDRLIVSALKGLDNKTYAQAKRSFNFEILDDKYETVATKNTYEYTNPKNISGGGESGEKGIIEITIPFDHIDEKEVDDNGNIKPRTYYLHELDNGLDYETNNTAYKIVVSGKQTTDSQKMDDGTSLTVTNNQITNVEVTTGRLDNGKFTDQDEKGQTIAEVPYAKKLDSGIEHAKSLWIGIKGVNKDDPTKVVNADEYTAQFNNGGWDRTAQNVSDNTTDFAGGMDSSWGVRNIDDNSSYNGGNDDKWNVTLSDAFTNKGVTSYSVEKVWDDGDNADRLESDVKVRLYEDGNSKAIREVTLNEGNNWKHTWKNLSSNKTYFAKEVKKDGTDDVENNQAFSGKDENDGYVANYKSVKNIEVKAENHPATVTVGLFMNGGAVEDNGQQIQKTLDASNNWDEKFENLDENGSYTVKVISPEVSDNDPQKYLYDITTFEYSGTVVSNHHTPEKTSYTVTKNWDDDNNHDGLRPASIKVQLYADGKPYGDPVEVKADNSWEYTWSDLTKNKNGKLIKYTADEVGTVDDYEKKVDGTVITNTHKNETTSVTVNKTWVDDNNNSGNTRPDKITVQLLKDDEPYGDPVEINATDGWTYTWDNLDKLEKDEKGNSKEVQYTVSEEPVLGYTASYNGMNITNTYTPGKTSYKVTKSWDDSDNADGIRPASVQVQLYANGNAYGNPVEVNATDGWTYEWTNLPDEYNDQPITYTADEVGAVDGYEKKVDGTVIVNTHKAETTSVSGTKTWNDGNDKNRPSSVKVYLTKEAADGNYYDVDGVDPVEVSEKNNWKYSFDNLQKNENGQPITYGVREEPVEGYRTDYNGTDITNTKIIDIPVTKTWNDNNNQDGIRPDKITVHLAGSYKGSDGKAQSVQIENNSQDITPDENGEWKYVFTDLPAYTDDGQKITYTVSEDPVDGYKTEVNGYEITNTHTPATTDISGSKTWNDNDNQDGIRPDEITVHLTGSYTDDDGNIQNVSVENDSLVVKPDKKGNWDYYFKDLPKYAEGKLISYSVTEEPVDGYETSYPVNDDGTPRDYALDGETITNTHTPAVTTYSVRKIWNDNDNRDGKRPESVSVQLKADNKNYGDPVTLTEAGPDNIVGNDDDWSYNWNDLPMYKNGKKIVYSAEETNVDSHYVATYEKDDDSTTVTNIYVPDKVKLTIHKSFKGDQISDKDKKNLTFRVTGIGKTVDQNGNEVSVKVDETITYASFKNGSYTFYQLYPGEYTVTETKSGIDGYSVKVNYIVDGKSTQKVNATQSEKEYQIDITDEYHKKPEEKKSADTSDHTNLPWSAGIFGAAMLIGVTALIFRRRYN